MSKFEIQVGRDARVYHRATIEAESLAAAMRLLSRHGYDAPKGTVWQEDGLEEFDHVEACHISEESGVVLASYVAGDGWVMDSGK